jgi:hypothetical protein
MQGDLLISSNGYLFPSITRFQVSFSCGTRTILNFSSIELELEVFHRSQEPQNLTLIRHFRPVPSACRPWGTALKSRKGLYLGPFPM